MSKPNPGSPTAKKQGCTCPIIDNHYGKGFMLSGKKVWWIDETCKLHAKRERK
jgi:hypothetical protein